MVALQALQVIVAPIPGQVVNFVAGYVFGFIPGALLSWLGPHWRRPRHDWPGSWLPHERLVTVILAWRCPRRREGPRFFFLVFLLPLLPDDAICLMAGLTPLPLSALILAAAVGRLPALAASVWAGAHAGALSPAVLAIAGLAGLALLVAGWRYGDRVEDALMERVTKLKG
jgi:uncharacterized membrane protein YdjX (TVP38/TMEM64 family)